MMMIACWAAIHLMTVGGRQPSISPNQSMEVYQSDPGGENSPQIRALWLNESRINDFSCLDNSTYLNCRHDAPAEANGTYPMNDDTSVSPYNRTHTELELSSFTDLPFPNSLISPFNDLPLPNSDEISPMAPIRVLRPQNSGLLRPTRKELARPILRGNDVVTSTEPLVPVNAAGFRCEDSPLVEEAGTRCSVLAKSFGPLGCQRILSELASERGRTLDNIPVAFRHRRVADACPASCGLCQVCSPGCASWFIGNGWCEELCNNKWCQWDGGDCWETDCVVTNWKRVSDCSITCDPAAPNGHGGTQTKYREVQVPATPNGRPCPPLEEKIYGCNANVPCPIECEVSHWSEWSQCSHTCGVGSQSRTRSIVRPPQHGAGKCPELRQSRPCFQSECATECKVSEWSEWSPCSVDCGGGIKHHTRNVLTIPIGVGAVCPPLYEEEECNTSVCVTSRSGCDFGDWSDWSDCDAPCGGGKMYKTRAALRECTAHPEDLYLERDCNSFECPQDCMLTGWSVWSPCDSECGTGNQRRTREIAVAPSSSGKPCGVLEETRVCFSSPCPIHCEVSDWSPWSDCNFNHAPSKTCGAGVESRGRTVITMPSNDGRECPTLMEFRDCFTECPDSSSADVCIPSKTRMTEWTSCEEGCFIGDGEPGGIVKFPQIPRQHRHNLIEYWGRKCPSDGAEYRNCIEHLCAEPNDNDCLVSAWSPWTSCSVQCGGGGSRQRSRSVLQPSAPSGTPCPPLVEAEECGFGACPIDCETTDWSAWSNCSAPCGAGHQTRTRNIAALANEHLAAKECGPLTQRMPCIHQTALCDLPCKVGRWDSWSKCEADCGKGLRRRTRRILEEPVGLGNICPDLEEVEECENEPCPRDCLLSEWSAWSDCTAPCLSPTDGMQTRYRRVLIESVKGGAACPNNLIESRRCRGGDECEKIHCDVSEWSDCSARCGLGETFRTPIPPKSGVETSVCAETKQIAPCFLATCPVDCVVSEWSEWSECTAKCNGGEQSRFRDIEVPAASGGQICPPLVEWQICNTQSCEALAREADCKMSDWSDWSACTAECGGGITSRTRSVLRPAAPGGQSCGNLQETRGCNLQRCPGVPCQDNPRFVAESGKQGITCTILRAQGCSINLWDLARKHGVDLPSEVPPEARVQDVCAMTCGVCEECAPGCELRDLGNTVCTRECDNGACEFDRGDCGGDCLIPSAYTNGGDMVLSPPVTALQEKQVVELRCPQGRRFSTLSAFEKLEIRCSSTSNGQKALQLVPDPWHALDTYTEDLSSLHCEDDKCPWVLIEGFDSDYRIMNGIYERNTPDDGPFSSFQRKVGAKGTLLLTAEDIGDEMAWRLGQEVTMDVPDVCLLPDIMSNACPMPATLGGDTDTTCVGGFTVLDPETDRAVVSLPEAISMRCITASEKERIKDTWSHKAPSTKLKNGPFEMELACEDVQMVKAVSGFDCDKLSTAVGCNFKLRDGGHDLPPILPPDATVGLVCPHTCDQCGICSPGCAHWFLGNGYCDVACNNAECRYDYGDCQEQIDTMSGYGGEERTLPPIPRDMAAKKGDETEEIVPVRRSIPGPESLVDPICMDDPIVATAGYTCSMIEMLAKSVGGSCYTPVVEIARSQPMLQSRLSPDFPSEFRLVDACPLTCGCCHCRDDLMPRRKFVPHLEFMATGKMSSEHDTTVPSVIQGETTVSYTGPCSDADEIIQATADMSCGDLVWLFKDCSTKLDDLGYLPEGTTTGLSISDMCPASCDVCTPASGASTSWACNDMNAVVQKFSSLTCTAVATFLPCATQIAKLGMGLPSGLPPDLSVSDLCPKTCKACPVAPVTTAPPAVATESPCIDYEWVEDTYGQPCKDLVDQIKDCTATLQSLRWMTIYQPIPPDIPKTASLADVCPRTCGTCDKTIRTCADAAEVSSNLGTSCAALISNDGCTGMLASSSIIKKTMPDSLRSASVGQVCRKSCGYCGTTVVDSASGGVLSSSSTCQDNPLLSQSGWSCTLFIQYGALGCETPVLQLVGTGHALPAGLAMDSLVKEACPQTCGVCKEGQTTVTTTTCEDSPILGAVGLSCDQVISMSGGGGPGCLTQIATIAGSLPVAGLLPEGMRVMDLCAKTCLYCTESACDDGYMNGDETGIDCGGSCRPCRACSSAYLKTLAKGIITAAVGSKEDFGHGAQRAVTCSDGYQSSLVSTEVITCQDGDWSSPSTKCEEQTMPVWAGTLGLTHGQDFDHNILPALLDTVIDAFEALRPGLQEDYYRISAGGSCAAMTTTSSGECEDNALVESMGFGCKMLAGLGCEQSLSYLAGLQGTPLPEGIPDDALVSDACPVTCDTCEEAIARMAEYMALMTNDDDPLGTDCLKADLLVKVTVDTQDLLEELGEALGVKYTISKHLTTIFKEVLTKTPVELWSNWTESGNKKYKFRQDGLAFVSSRPVELLLRAPESDTSGFAIGGGATDTENDDDETEAEDSTAAPAASSRIPMEQKNVSLTLWNEGLRAGQEGFYSRRVFKLNGVTPAPSTALSSSEFYSGMEPAVTDSFNVTSDRLRGHYFATNGHGSVLGQVAEVLRDCDEDSRECCEVISVLDDFLDSECGVLLFSQMPSAEDLVQFCRMPEVEQGTLSCLARLKAAMWSYRKRGQWACRGADLAVELFESACSIDPTDGTYCLLKMDSDVASVTLEKFAQKSAEVLNYHCDRDSCMRNHFRFIRAVSTLTAGYSTHRLKEEGKVSSSASSTDEDTRMLQMLNEQYRLRRLSESVEDRTMSHLADLFDNMAPVRRLAILKRTLDVNAATIFQDFQNWDTPLLPDMAPPIRQLSSSGNDDPRTGHLMFDIEKYGERFLDLVCVKSEGVYCQQSLQLLSDADPIAKPDLLTNACSHGCYSTVVRKLGSLIRDHGRDLRSPRHLALGSMMNHYGRWACQTNQMNTYCHNTLTKSPGPTVLAHVFNITRPPFEAVDCASCASSYLSDGSCDRDCFHPGCGFDGSDCIAWNMYPDSFNRYLNAICIRSLSDPCNPLLKSSSCSSTSCKARMKMCLESNGCCYTAALEALRATLQTQKELMQTVWTEWLEANPAGYNDKNNTKATFYDAFNLDRSPASYELECGVSLDRACANGVSYKYHSFTVDIANVRSPQSPPRLLLSADMERRLPRGYQGSVEEWLQTPEARERFSEMLDLVPSDIARLLWTSDDIGSSILQIDVDAGRLPMDVHRIRSILPEKVLGILEDLPAFWADVVNATKVPTASTIHSLMNPSNNLNYAQGAWGLGSMATQRSAAACSSEALWQLSGKGMVIQSSSELTSKAIADGTELSVSCMGGFIGSTKSSKLRCENGVWLNPSAFVCERPCASDPFTSLGLNSDAIYVQPASLSSNLTKLFPPSSLEHQVSLVPGTKYRSGSSILLSCAEGYSANVTAGSAVDVTTCHIGKWSKTTLDCQPPCPEMPIWAEEGGYIITNSEDCRYGAVRTLKCASGFFPVPPSTEATTGVPIRCMRETVWSQPSFKCIQGKTIDPLGGPNTVQKMLATLFSTTGIVSLAVFFACMLLLIVLIMILWKLFYKHKAEQSYLKQFDLLAEYVTANLSYMGQGGGHNPISSVETRAVLLGERLLEIPSNDFTQVRKWHMERQQGRNDEDEESESSSTISAMARVARLARQDNAYDAPEGVDENLHMHQPFHSGIVHPFEAQDAAYHGKALDYPISRDSATDSEGSAAISIDSTQHIRHAMPLNMPPLPKFDHHTPQLDGQGCHYRDPESLVVSYSPPTTTRRRKQHPTGPIMSNQTHSSPPPST